jgi:hypothetical protein
MVGETDWQLSHGERGRLYVARARTFTYAKTGYLWEVAAVVGPIIKPGDFADSVLGHNKPDTLIFNDFESWLNMYFEQLSEEQKRKVRR